jgi:uncharacterized protein (DUF488 family)
MCRTRRSMFLYSIGINGFRIDTFLDQLAAAHIGLLLDVRRHARCKTRDGLSNMVLRQVLHKAGISYIHIPKAGSPATSPNCLKNYERYLQDNRSVLWDLLCYIRRASERGQTVCFTCNKKIAAECHRSALVDALLKMDPALSAIHLPVTQNLPQISPIDISTNVAWTSGI